MNNIRVNMLALAATLAGIAPISGEVSSFAIVAPCYKRGEEDERVEAPATPQAL